MDKIKTISKISILVSFLLLINAACTNRESKAVSGSDSSLVYPAKNKGDIEANLSFCRKIDRETGELIGEGSVFTIMDKVWIQAIANIENRFSSGHDNLMFHFDWIDGDGKTVYIKRVDLSPNDSTSIINSAISLSPETRDPGEYTLKLYYFRELIAEKKIKILPEFNVDTYNTKALFSNLTLCKSLDRKTGNFIGIDSVFTIMDYGTIQAVFDLENRNEFGERELLFSFDWYYNDTVPYYRKRIEIPVGDSDLRLNSSISIAPDKREVGEYTLKLSLFNKPIAERNFELLPEPELPDVKASIKFYRKQSKKTGKLIGEGSVFKIGKRQKVRALVNLNIPKDCNYKDLEFTVKWINSSGKSFYKKNLKLTNKSSSLKSAISITPGKRQPGKYSMQVYLYGKLIQVKNYTIQ